MSRSSRQLGLTLVELLIGLTVGLIVLLVVSQVMQSFEGQKRTSTGGNDAQTSGALALYLLDQDIRMAGYGFFGPEQALCPLGINIYNGAASPPVVANAVSWLPIRIVDGGDGPDSIITMRSNSETGAVPMSIVKAMPTPSSIVTTSSGGGLKDGDLFVVAARDGSKVCTLMQMSRDPQVTGNGINLNHNSGVTSPYNPPNLENTFDDAPAYGINDIVVGYGNPASLGRQFSVQCDQLVTSNPVLVGTPDCTNTSPLVAQIVDLQARYGVSSAAGSTTINAWVDATAAPWNDPGEADMKRIRAIRLAVVSQNPQYEKEVVTPETLTLWPNGPQISVADRNYRYRVYETIIPLRNVIWAP